MALTLIKSGIEPNPVADQEEHYFTYAIYPHAEKWQEAKTVEQAKAAEAGGADYLGVGAMYPTDTKSDTSQVTVETLKAICRAVDIPVVIVHLTNEAALREVEAARKRGQRVYVETCPQYLVLEDSVYDDPDYSRAARYVCAPPIRKERDQQALWTALRKGEIQTVSTDHCSFTLEQKDAGRGDFTRIPGGLPGVENRVFAQPRI